MMSTHLSHRPLFGGSKAWNMQEWTSSDDRVRGGSSQSTLTCPSGSRNAEFHGNLNITTLGGAGFASQRTRGETQEWDVSGYDGIEIRVDSGDSKVYTITLKNEIPPKWLEKGEQSTVSWEYDFRARQAGAETIKETVFVKWNDFKPTYRGKPVKYPEPLDLKRIRRFGIMIRSFFGEQEGDFSLGIISISAVQTERYLDDPREDGDHEVVDEKSGSGVQTRADKNEG